MRKKQKVNALKRLETRNKYNKTERDHPREDDNYHKRHDGWLSKKRVAEVKERLGVL